MWLEGGQAGGSSVQFGGRKTRLTNGFKVGNKEKKSQRQILVLT